MIISMHINVNNHTYFYDSPEKSIHNTILFVRFFTLLQKLRIESKIKKKKRRLCVLVRQFSLLRKKDNVVTAYIYIYIYYMFTNS